MLLAYVDDQSINDCFCSCLSQAKK